MVSFNYETHEGLETWLNIWEKLLENSPENIIFSLNFRNLVINSYWRLSKVGTNDLLKYSTLYLQNIVKNRNYEIEILEKRIGAGYVNKFKGGKHSEIELVLSDIVSKLSGKSYLEFLINELETLLSKKGDIGGDSLSTICQLILAETLAKYSPKELKKLPREVFSKEYTRIRVERKKKTLFQNNDIETKFYEIAKYELSVVDFDSKSNEIASKAKVLLGDLFPTTYWQRDLIFFFDRIKENLIHVTQVIEANFSGDVNDTTIESLFENEVIYQELKDIYFKFLNIFISEVIRGELEQQIKSGESLISNFIDALCDTIDDGEFCDIYHKSSSKDLSEVSGQRNTSVKNEIKGNLPFWIGDVLAQIIIDKIDLEEIKKPNQKLAEFLLSELSSIFTKKDGRPSDECLEMVFNREKRENLGLCLVQEVNKIPFQKITESLITGGLFDHGWNIFSEKFIERFTVKFGKPRNFRHLPWDELQKGELKTILSKFLEELSPKKQEWNVVYIVKKINPEGKKFSVGNILFYDPNIWNFGEGLFFDHTLNNGEVKIYARVKVKATTEYEAKQIGFLQVQKALDTMTFVHSVLNTFGINPSIGEQIFIQKGDKGFGFTSTATISRFAMQNNVIQDKIAENSQVYSGLLEKGNTIPDSLNELQQSFLKAVGWYRKGRWKEDYISRYLDYWIALEHILVEGEMKKLEVLRKRLPLFHISWRNASRGWVLKQYWKQILKFIRMDSKFEAKINGDSDLINWSKHDYVLLNPDNLRRLIGYTDNQDVKDYIKRFIDEELTEGQISSYKYETRLLREQFEFKIFLLNSLRNDIVHGAVDFHPSIELYFRELKEIVEGSLLKILNEAIDSTSKCKTLDDLLVDLEKPW